MKNLAAALVLVLVVATLAHAGPGGIKYGQHTIHGMHYDRAAVEKLLDDSEVPAEVSADERGIQKLNGKFRLDRSKPVEEAAVDFIDRHRDAFKLNEPKKDLKQRSRDVLPDGCIHLSFQQVYNGVPVWGKYMGVTIDKDNIEDIGAGITYTPDIDTTPLVTEEEAVEIVTKGIEEIGEEVDKSGPALVTGLVIYIAAKNPVLCYTVTISTYIPTGSWLFFVDARKGRIITREPLSFF